jgi:sulfur relay (sulfurtransferase) DsrC/TusE family protein
MSMQANGKNGYLGNPWEWTGEFAQNTASNFKLLLTPSLWGEICELRRDFFPRFRTNNQNVHKIELSYPIARHVCDGLFESERKFVIISNQLYKIAGLPYTENLLWLESRKIEPPAVGEDGFLISMDSWDGAFADCEAKKLQIDLTPMHWQCICNLRINMIGESERIAINAVGSLTVCRTQALFDLFYDLNNLFLIAGFRRQAIYAPRG